MISVALLSAQSSIVEGITNSTSTMTTEQIQATLGVAGLIGYFAIPSVLLFTAIIVIRHHRHKRKLQKDLDKINKGKEKEAYNDKQKKVETTILTVEDSGESISIPVEEMKIEFDGDGTRKCP